LDAEKTTIDHIDYVVEHMRQADVDEVVAAGHTPREALIIGMVSSDSCVTLLYNDIPVVIFGILSVTLLGNVGRPWLLGTTDAPKHRRAFAQLPKYYLDSMLEMYPVLENYVHVKNRVSVRWLKYLGFQFDEPVTLPNGEQFIRFWMKRGDNV